MELLLGQSIDPYSKDEEGRTPLSWAISYDHEAAAALLRDHGVIEDCDVENGTTDLSRSQDGLAETNEEPLLLRNGVEESFYMIKIQPSPQSRSTRGLQRPVDFNYYCLLCSGDQPFRAENKGVMMRHIKKKHYWNATFYCTEASCPDFKAHVPIGHTFNEARTHYLDEHSERVDRDKIRQAKKYEPHPPVCPICQMSVSHWGSLYACLMQHCGSTFPAGGTSE
jgi:hypothetical protein